MRGGLAALTVAVLLVGGGDERADVLVPDDPPGFTVKPGRLVCAAAAGDTVVANVHADTDTWIAPVSDAGGALAPDPGRDRVPVDRRGAGRHGDGCVDELGHAP